MPTSTRFAVSVHTLALLVRQAGKPLRSEEVAADVGTNPAVIRALLSRLSAAGLTTSQRGSGGGAVLAKAADQIRLLDVYLGVEDREIFSFHRSGQNDGQGIGSHVATSLADPLLRARQAMEDVLAAVSIQNIADDIVRRDAGIAPAKPTGPNRMPDTWDEIDSNAAGDLIPREPDDA